MTDHERVADTVVFAATVHTLRTISNRENADRVSAVGIIDSVIAMVGTRDDASTWVDRTTRVIDLGSATLTPGLVDAHIHPVMGLELARGVDLNGYTTLENAMTALAEHASGLASDDWVLGWGLDPNVYGTMEITNDPLRNAIGERLTFITLFDSHSALASDGALDLAGVYGERDFPDASHIAVDGAGRPTGLLLESSAIALLQEVLPPLTFTHRVELLYDLLFDMAGSGLTGGHVMDLHSPDTFDLLAEIERTRELPIRLRISPQLRPGFSQDDLDALVHLQRRRGRRWHVEGVKLMID